MAKVELKTWRSGTLVGGVDGCMQPWCGKAWRQGLGWREMLHRSGTTLHLGPGGQLEVKLRI